MKINRIPDILNKRREILELIVDQRLANPHVTVNQALNYVLDRYDPKTDAQGYNLTWHAARSLGLYHQGNRLANDYLITRNNKSFPLRVYRSIRDISRTAEKID